MGNALRALSFLLACAGSLSICPADIPVADIKDVTTPTLAPISLNVKDATLETVATALSDVTGTTIALSTQTAARESSSTARYTCSVANKPFWDAYAQLTEQHGINLVFPLPRQSVALCIVPKYEGPHQLPTIATSVGDFRVEVADVTRNERDSSILLNWSVAADPRLAPRIVSGEFPPFQHVIDDRGNELQFFSLPRISAYQRARPRGSLWTLQEAFAVPKDHATKIASLRGVFFVVEKNPTATDEKGTTEFSVPFEIKDIPLP